MVLICKAEKETQRYNKCMDTRAETGWTGRLKLTYDIIDTMYNIDN